MHTQRWVYLAFSFLTEQLILQFWAQLKHNISKICTYLYRRDFVTSENSFALLVLAVWRSLSACMLFCYRLGKLFRSSCLFGWCWPFTRWKMAVNQHSVFPEFLVENDVEDSLLKDQLLFCSQKKGLKPAKWVVLKSLDLTEINRSWMWCAQKTVG